MLKTLLLSFLLFVSSGTIAAAPKRRKHSSRTKGTAVSSVQNGDDVGKLLLTKMQFHNVIPLTDSNFSKFVSQKSRDYSAIVMFTDYKVDHEACVKSSIMLAEVAEHYQNQFDFNTSSKMERLAFFIVNVHTGRRIFQDMELEYIPRLFIYPVESAHAHLATVEISLQQVLDGLTTFTAAITEATGIKIIPMVSPAPLLALWAIIATIFAFLVSAVAVDLSKAIYWYRSRYLWMTVNIIIFSIGVSGSLFCYIRNAPTYVYESKDLIRIFAERDQFVLEGFLVAIWTVSCAFALTLLKASTKMSFAPLRHVMVIFSLALFIVFGIQIFEAYAEKTKWYAIQDTLPRPLWNFLKSSVKKNSGLLKRLLRVSEIWLFEYKDGKGYRNKFQILVIDYLKRSIFRSSKLD